MLKRCGAGYAVFALALRLPSVLPVDAPLRAFSRFFNDSFFSRCSRWMGAGAGVFDWPRELAGLSGDGATGVCALSVEGCKGVGAPDPGLLSAMVVEGCTTLVSVPAVGQVFKTRGSRLSASRNALAAEVRPVLGVQRVSPIPRLHALSNHFHHRHKSGTERTNEYAFALLKEALIAKF